MAWIQELSFWQAFGLEMLVKSTLVLLVVTAAAWSMEKVSAALKHMIWLAAFILILLMPAALLLLPSIPIGSGASPQGARRYPAGELSADSDPGERTAQTAGPPGKSVQTERDGEAKGQSPPIEPIPAGNLPLFLMVAWGAGWLWMLLHLAVGFLRSRSIRQGSVVRDEAALKEIFAEEPGPKPDLLFSFRVLTPIAMGIGKPAMVLPMESLKWDRQKLQSAVLHEWAHIRRKDNFTRFLAALGRAFYWFNPLAWYAYRKCVEEQEKAADDDVLNRGVKPSSYAESLLEIVKDIRGMDGHRGLLANMGSYSFFPRRMQSILAENRSRTRVARRHWILATGLGLLLATPVFLLSNNRNRVPLFALRTLSAERATEPHTEFSGLIQNQADAFNRRDWEALAGSYHAQAVVFDATGRTDGSLAVVAGYMDLAELGWLMEVRLNEVLLEKDTAYLTLDFAFTGPDRTTALQGTALSIRKRVQGKWQVWREQANARALPEVDFSR